MAMDQSTGGAAGVRVEQDLWRGIETRVRPCEGVAGSYRVVFWPAEPMQARGPNGEYPRVPFNAVVTVITDPDLRVRSYDPPEKPDPNLTQDDYEAKAVEAVRKEIKQGGMLAAH